MEYLPTEKVMVVKKKEHFYNLTKTERRLPPMLTMQVWDNDLFSPDDFLGKHIIMLAVTVDAKYGVQMYSGITIIRGSLKKGHLFNPRVPAIVDRN